MSFSETIFLFFLALIVFGPKKLPEIARQAGRLLAELRRASNEFKSQIETEIAHLEVQDKLQKTKTELPSSPNPQGTVASLSLNPASGQTNPPPEPVATLAAPAASVPAIATASNIDPSTELATDSSESTSQASHV